MATTLATALISDVTDDSATGEPWKADTYLELRECADILRTPRTSVKESDYAER